MPATHSLAEVTALLLLCAVLFFPPYEAVVSGSDATVYANWGRKVAEAGALVFEDAFVEGLPADARAELFENRTQFRRTGRLHRFPGGFQIASATEPTVSASFAPLFRPRGHARGRLSPAGAAAAGAHGRRRGRG